MTAFADCFWGTDFNSTVGFDSLCKKMKDGSQICQYFEEFIRQRADAEEKYGKSLVKLAKIPLTGEEYGTMYMSWEVIKQETENIGQAHIDLSQKLLSELEKAVRDFRELQKNKRKPIEETIKRDQLQKKRCFENTAKLKKSYELRCKEKDGAEETLTRMSKQSLSPKDEEKLRRSVTKAKTACEQSDYSYQASVRQLEEARLLWEKDFEDYCKEMQNLEKERISHLRNIMWVYTNFGSVTCVKDDLSYEDMRKVLEHCDVNKDVHLFISMRQTGHDRPAPILYENYYMSNRPVPPTPRSLPNQPNINISNPLPPSGIKTQIGSINEDPVVQIPRPDVVIRLVKAEFEYEAQGDQELSFKAGSIIKVLYDEGEVWSCGEFDGKRGMFPRSYVEPI